MQFVTCHAVTSYGDTESPPLCVCDLDGITIYRFVSVCQAPSAMTCASARKLSVIINWVYADKRLHRNVVTTLPLVILLRAALPFAVGRFHERLRVT